MALSKKTNKSATADTGNVEQVTETTATDTVEQVTTTTITEGTDKAASKPKNGSEVIVKNISNFTQHHEGQYFSPGLEVRTKYNKFVKASIKSGIFVLMDK